MKPRIKHKLTKRQRMLVIRSSISYRFIRSYVTEWYLIDEITRKAYDNWWHEQWKRISESNGSNISISELLLSQPSINLSRSQTKTDYKFLKDNEIEEKL